MNKTICVFCSSSDRLKPVFYDAARELGTRIGLEGDRLVYGGTAVGLMGETARSAKENGAHVTGVIPKRIHDAGIGWDQIDEYIITTDMRERKALLSERADAFIALPGGFGTLEEILEVMTLKQLGYHQKPVLFLNTDRFYDPLLAHFDTLYAQRFAKESFRSLYFSAAHVDEAYGYIKTYQAEVSEAKWG